MPLDAELGKKMLQLITSRYDDRHWRKKIEKTLSLPQSGVGDPAQQQIFMYLKIGLKAYKSRRADPDSWIIGGYATKEIIERAKFQPQLVGPDITKDDVAFLGSDPGKEIDEAWWDEMLVSWFDVPEEEKPAEEEGGEAADSDSSSTIKVKVLDRRPCAFALASRECRSGGSWPPQDLLNHPTTPCVLSACKLAEPQTVQASPPALLPLLPAPCWLALTLSHSWPRN